MMSSFVYELLILLPPAISLLYAISVQIFLSGWHECSWSHLSSSILLRIAIFILAIGVCVPLHEMMKEDKEETLTPFLPAAILSPILSVICIYRVRRKYVQGPKPQLKENQLTGRVALVTGSNAGIGKETATQLLAAGATVIMACRSESRANVAMEEILQVVEQITTSIHPHGEETSLSGGDAKPPRDRLIFLPLDVSDYTSVREAVQEFEKMNLPLHILVNNAGIMMHERRTNGNDGHELMMACNHLGHFLLTNLLLPKLQAVAHQNGDARIVIVTSSTYHLASNGIDLEDLNCERRNFTMFSQYAQSKLANIMMGKELARRETKRVMEKDEGNGKVKHVSVHIVHPGLVRTSVTKNMKWYIQFLNMLFSGILVTLQKTPEAGAYTNVFCATTESLEDSSGEYFSNSESFPTNEYANDAEKALALWDLSMEMVGLKDSSQ